MRQHRYQFLVESVMEIKFRVVHIMRAKLVMVDIQQGQR